MVAYPEKTKTVYTKILVMFPHIVAALPDGLVQGYQVLGGSEGEKWRKKRLAVVGSPRMHALVRCSEYGILNVTEIEDWTPEILEKAKYMYGVMTFQDTIAWNGIRKKFGLEEDVTSLWPSFLAPGYGPAPYNCHQVLAGYLYFDLETDEHHLVGMDGGWDIVKSNVYSYVCRGVQNLNVSQPSAWLMSLLMRGTPHSLANKHSIGEPIQEGGHDKVLERCLDGVGFQYLRNVENVNETLRGNPIAVHDMVETSGILQEAYVGPTIYMGGEGVPLRTLRYQMEASVNANNKIDVKKSQLVSDMPIDAEMRTSLLQVFEPKGLFPY